jgi:hypothetical protein
VDGTFACPECGSEVKVQGLAPGRQVRCGFCHRLLEVPYLPRAGDAPWKRRRFVHAKWVPWAWIGIAVIALFVVATGAVGFLKRQYDSIQDRSISQLFESSRRHEAEGQLGEALIDLDTALELARKAGPSLERRLGLEQARRPDLARRDAEVVLKGLVAHEPSSFQVGNWLNLIARTARDPDLASLLTPIKDQFQAALNRQVAFDLKAARAGFQSGNLGASLTACDQIGRLLEHLAESSQARVRSDTEEIVKRITALRGVQVEAPEGRFLFGAKSYVAELLPVLERALEAKGYVPRRASSPWRDLWTGALYHMRLDVIEMQEGSYLSSQNRLTRIEAGLTLTSRGNLVWHTTPTVRSEVPLPKLPAYLASRVAISSERSEEFERLLYKNARERIDEKFRYALDNMPECTVAPGKSR